MSAPVVVVLCGILFIVAVFAFCKKFFREYQLTENSGKCTLVGQLRYGISSAELPNPSGKHVYTITTNGGTLRMNHHALNPDGFTWTAPPGHGEREYFEINEKTTNTFTITIGESFKHPDKVEVVNPHFRDNVEFSYSID